MCTAERLKACVRVLSKGTHWNVSYSTVGNKCVYLFFYEQEVSNPFKLSAFN